MLFDEKKYGIIYMQVDGAYSVTDWLKFFAYRIVAQATYLGQVYLSLLKRVCQRQPSKKPK